MQDTDRATNRPGGQALAFFLLMAAASVFVFAYRPGHRETERLERSLAEIRGRVTRLHAMNDRIETRCAALRAGDPEVLGEAAREALRKGRAGEFAVRPE